ncbi:type II secretion system protein [bacterium]|nr:type II secretion system protein [bacterium]
MKGMKVNVRKKKRGFTVLEMILALIIMGIIVTVLTPLFRNSISMYIYTTEIAEEGQIARIAFNRMLMDMRDITTLNSGTSTSIDFIDVDNDNLNYYVSGSNLFLNGSLAAENLNDLTIEYIDWNGASIDEPDSSTWQIRITMEFDIMGSPQTYTGEIQPRNWQGGI